MQQEQSQLVDAVLGALECTHGATEDVRGKAAVSLRGKVIVALELLEQGRADEARSVLREALEPRWCRDLPASNETGAAEADRNGRVLVNLSLRRDGSAEVSFATRTPGHLSEQARKYPRRHASRLLSATEPAQGHLPAWSTEGGCDMSPPYAVALQRTGGAT